jgi:pilus assembly protein Flp/PilA
VRQEKDGAKMNWLNNRILKLKVWTDCNGQDLVEYALAAGMVAVAAVAAMPGLSGTVNNVFSKIGSIITANVH